MVTFHSFLLVYQRVSISIPFFSVIFNYNQLFSHIVSSIIIKMPILNFPFIFHESGMSQLNLHHIIIISMSPVTFHDLSAVNWDNRVF